MKDIIITPKRLKTELVSLLLCFVIAFAMNVYAIIAYGGEWKELFWSLGFVAVMAAALYAVWAVIRIAFYVIKRFSNTKKQ